MRTLGLLTGALTALALVLPATPASAQDATALCIESESKAPRSRVYSTIPALPGVVVKLGERSYRTNSTGWFVVGPDARHCKGDLQNVSVPGDVTMGNGLTARQQRVFSRTIAFGTHRTVRFDFRTEEGTPLPRSALGRVRVKSSTGAVYDLPPEGQLELHAQRVVPLNGGLVVKNIYYTVESVLVGGNNVVNRSQIRFHPATQDSVTVPMLYYAADVQVKDRLLRGPVGDAVLVRRPDGTVSRHVLQDGRVTLPLLPRGDYELQAEAAGLRVWRPVAMSRDQQVELDVVTHLDLLLLGLAGTATAVGALLVGRRRARRAALARVLVIPAQATGRSEADGPGGRTATVGQRPSPPSRPLPVPLPVRVVRRRPTSPSVLDLSLPALRTIDLRTPEERRVDAAAGTGQGPP